MDQRLIRDAAVSSLLLEIFNCFSIQINRDLAFLFFGVRIWLSIGKIIFVLHVLSPLLLYSIP